MNFPFVYKTVPSYTPSSGFTEETLKEALEDAVLVRLTALANAKAALDDAFLSHTPPTHSLNEIDSGVSKAIEDVKPQIGYPGYVKPTLPPVSKEPELSREQEKLNRFGMTIPNRDFLKELIESDIGEAKEEGDYDDVIDTYSNAISGPLDPTYYKPNPDPSGAFQRSLKPKSNTNDNYDFIVAIGNPHSNRLILNCIENSRKELIHFKDNFNVIKQAIDKFNVDYDPQSMTKTVLAGRDDRHYLNINLQFDTLDFDGLEIRAHFSKHEVLACSGGVDYIKCIKETVYFYLKGELYLNENETKIEAMEITALNYANPSRNIISEKFVYLH